MNIGKRSVLTAAAVFTLLATLAGCSRANNSSGSDTTATNQGPASEVHLGFFPNVTHAAALIGVDKGYFTQELGGGTKLTTATFNAGPAEVSALLGGSVDIAFVGSGPTLNAYSQSNGGVRLIAGASSGGAELVVQPGINSAADLKGKVVSDPQAGNTQDVSLKTWLASNNLTNQVKVDNIANSTTLTEFKKGDIQGSWVPEPYASQLVLNDGGKVLVDERSLWPNGQFPTTVVLVRKAFLDQHPGTVTAILKGESDAINYATSDKAGAEAAVNDELQKLTGASLSQQVIDRAFGESTLTLDPLASDFPTLAQDQVTAGAAKSIPKLTGLADLTLINQILTAAGKPAVSAGSIGS